MYTPSPKDTLSLTAKCPVAIYTDSTAAPTALRSVSVSYTHRSSAAGWSFHWCHHCPQPDFLEALGTVTCFIALQPSGRASPFLISYLVGRPKTPNCPVYVLPDTMNCMEKKKTSGNRFKGPCFLSNLQNKDGPWVSRGSTGDDRNNNHPLSTRVHPRPGA